MLKQQVAAPVGVQSARRFTATAAYNETNPFAIRFRGPKGTVSYSLGHQPKSFDWRARRAQPHLWKKAPEDAFANGLRNAEPDYCRRLRGSSTPHPSTAPVCNPLRRCTVFSSETVLVVFWGGTARSQRAIPPAPQSRAGRPSCGEEEADEARPLDSSAAPEDYRCDLRGRRIDQ